MCISYRFVTEIQVLRHRTFLSISAGVLPDAIQSVDECQQWHFLTWFCNCRSDSMKGTIRCCVTCSSFFFAFMLGFSTLSSPWVRNSRFKNQRHKCIYSSGKCASKFVFSQRCRVTIFVCRDQPISLNLRRLQVQIESQMSDLDSH